MILDPGLEGVVILQVQLGPVRFLLKMVISELRENGTPAAECSTVTEIAGVRAQLTAGSRGCVLRSGAVMVYDCFQACGPGIIIKINCEAPVSTFCGTGAMMMMMTTTIMMVMVVVVVVMMIVSFLCCNHTPNKSKSKRHMSQ